jgi:uncharacterized protein involved in high-affinity Fe2+ transport
MSRQWARPLITALIVVGVALIVVLNLDLGSLSSTPPPQESSKANPDSATPAPARRALPAGFREYPIGDEMVKNAIQVAAVWLPSVQTDGMEGLSDPSLIHLEADVRATEGNLNGFAMHEFVPYLKIRYTISPAAGGPPVHQGELIPMVAGDGLHYGVNITMPRAGSYRLTYQIAPPSVGGLGRHSDPATGVAPWWPPFEATFDWDYPGPPQAEPTASNP